ncbi:unnamed protein product [Chrysoparadoxa australica]
MKTLPSGSVARTSVDFGIDGVAEYALSQADNSPLESCRSHHSSSSSGR